MNITAISALEVNGTTGGEQVTTKVNCPRLNWQNKFTSKVVIC
jgi:hypothetical protein